MNPATPSLTVMRLMTVVTGVLAFGLTAHATPVVTVGAASTGSANGVGGINTSYSVPNYADMATSATGASGSASSYGWARTSGAYAVNSTANGIGQSTAHAEFSYVLVNDTGLGQNYIMNFSIYHGSISAAGSSLLAGESLSASYGTRITVGSNTLFSTAANISRDSSGIHFSNRAHL